MTRHFWVFSKTFIVFCSIVVFSLSAWAKDDRLQPLLKNPNLAAEVDLASIVSEDLTRWEGNPIAFIASSEASFFVGLNSVPPASIRRSVIQSQYLPSLYCAMDYLLRNFRIFQELANGRSTPLEEWKDEVSSLKGRNLVYAYEKAVFLIRSMTMCAMTSTEIRSLSDHEDGLEKSKILLGEMHECEYLLFNSNDVSCSRDPYPSPELKRTLKRFGISGKFSRNPIPCILDSISKALPGKDPSFIRTATEDILVLSLYASDWRRTAIFQQLYARSGQPESVNAALQKALTRRDNTLELLFDETSTSSILYQTVFEDYKRVSEGIAQLDAASVSVEQKQRFDSLSIKRLEACASLWNLLLDSAQDRMICSNISQALGVSLPTLGSLFHFLVQGLSEQYNKNPMSCLTLMDYLQLVLEKEEQYDITDLCHFARMVAEIDPKSARTIVQDKINPYIRDHSKKDEDAYMLALSCKAYVYSTLLNSLLTDSILDLLNKVKGNTKGNDSTEWAELALNVAGTYLNLAFVEDKSHYVDSAQVVLSQVVNPWCESKRFLDLSIAAQLKSSPRSNEESDLDHEYFSQMNERFQKSSRTIMNALDLYLLAVESKQIDWIEYYERVSRDLIQEKYFYISSYSPDIKEHFLTWEGRLINYIIAEVSNEVSLWAWIDKTKQEMGEEVSIQPHQYVSSFCRLLYDYALAYKGAILRSNQVIKSYFSKTDTPSARRLYEASQQRQRSVSSLLSMKQKSIDVTLSAIVRDQSVLTREVTTWEDVAKSLKEEEYALEFIDFGDMVCALVLSHDADSPKRVGFLVFDEEDSIGPEIYDLESEFHKDLHSRISIRELEELIPDHSTVYYSPDGIVNSINCNWICDSLGTPFCEKYHMIQVSSTRRIPENLTIADFSEAALFGNLDYDMGSALKNTPSRNKGASLDFVIPRGDISSYTRDEVQQISEILTGASIGNQVFEKERGNLAAFRALSGSSYDLLHISTHGFYWEEEEYQGKEYAPMLRSGLVFSGKDVPDIFSEESGALYAADIARMDLSQVKLAVLSACQTASGEVSVDGVMGVQRGFKQAGAGAMLLTLWPVDAHWTQELMRMFYSNLVSGMDARASLFQAQKELREIPECQDWPAFILVD